MNREQLMKLLEEKRTAALAIIENAKAAKRDLTDEERTSRDALLKEFDDAKTKLDRLDADEAAERRLAETRSETATDKPSVEFPDADKRMAFKGLGEFMQSVADAATRKVDERLTYFNNKHIAEQRAEGMNVTTPADGGFFLQPKLIQELLGVDTGTVNQAVINKTRRFSDNGSGIIIPRIVETDRGEGNRGGALRAYRKAEAADMAAATAKLGNLELYGTELSFLLPVTNKLLRNAPALVSQVKGLVVPEMYHRIVYELIQGSGSGECQGLLNSPAEVTVAKKNGQPADSIVMENIDDMENVLDVNSKFGAVYLINQFAPKWLKKLHRAIGTGGELERIYKPNARGAGLDELNGRECYQLEQCPALGTVGDIILVDLSKYIMLFDPSVNGEASMHVYYVSNETAFRWVWNVSGEFEWASTKIAEDDSGTEISPIITLATR